MKEELNLNSCRGTTPSRPRAQYAFRKDGAPQSSEGGRISRRVLRACLKQRLTGKKEVKQKRLSVKRNVSPGSREPAYAYIQVKYVCIEAARARRSEGYWRGILASL